jgi:hypothetical protein
MGFSVGGEYIAVVAYLLEGAPRNSRGLITSMASASSEIGGLLAVGVSLLTVNSVSSANLDLWGWRIPFLVGAVLAASVWIARTTMEESPDFERQQISGTVPARPLLHALANHRAGILRAFAISALGSITYYVGITYVPTFLISTGKLDEGDSLRLSTAAAVAVILVTPFAGALSDQLGRRKQDRDARQETRPDFSQRMQRDPAYRAISSDGRRLSSIRSLRGRDSRLCRWSGQRRRRHNDRRTIPRGRTHQRFGPGGNFGHRHLWRSYPLCCPGPDRTNRLDNGPGRHDCRCGRLGPPDIDDFAGDGTHEIIMLRTRLQSHPPLQAVT